MSQSRRIMQAKDLEFFFFYISRKYLDLGTSLLFLEVIWERHKTHFSANTRNSVLDILCSKIILFQTKLYDSFWYFNILNKENLKQLFEPTQPRFRSKVGSKQKIIIAGDRPYSMTYVSNRMWPVCVIDKLGTFLATHKKSFYLTNVPD